MKPDQSIQNRNALASYKLAISRYIRSVMMLKGVKYNDLTEGLSQKGIVMTTENLRSKISKGIFSADLLTAIIHVLGAEEDAMREIIKHANND